MPTALAERNAAVHDEVLAPLGPRVRILAANVTALGFNDVISRLVGWARRRDRGRMVCVANVHMLVEAKRDPAFAEILEGADAVVPDGMPLVWLLRRAGFQTQDRVAGMDLLPALCAAAEATDISVYFLGSTESVLAALKAKLRAIHPRLRIVGMEAPPFRETTQLEDAAIVERIRRAEPGFLFVALGCPRQEKWIDRNIGNLRCVAIGVGAALPVFAGVRRRAPATMQRSGLEWLYRLGQEPGRLWKRYLTSNLLFAWWVLRNSSLAGSED
jgi:N-acetylglucosaminyldiphosphoundecaprenol N-acetyl-beta-D-mannosaminyltransferase